MSTILPNIKRAHNSSAVADALKNWGEPNKKPPKLVKMLSKDGNIKNNELGDYAHDDDEALMNNPFKYRPQSEDRQRQMHYSDSKKHGISSMPNFNEINGKAFLIDLDSRFETQEKMNNYLMSQVNALEMHIQNLTKKNSQLQGAERDSLMKIENSIKFNNDQSHFTVAELASKIKLFEENFSREEKVQRDLRERLKNAEENQREVMLYVKNIQSQEDTELAQLRALLHDKTSEGHITNVKQKEKSTALFHELVRIGEEHEKHAQAIQNITLALETKFNNMEARVNIVENNVVGGRNNDNTGMMVDIIDKLEGKVQELEYTLHQLTDDYRKEKENMSRLEFNGIKNTEEYRSLIAQIQDEFQNRLESRVSEVVNRLVREQEDRIRITEDIRYQMEMKDKMNNEMSKFERDEMRDRYAQMDAIVRTEFQRKDEAIFNLQTNFEAQIRILQNWVKKEELARTHQEIEIKGELGKAQEQTRHEIEAFKTQQLIIMEKSYAMMKMQAEEGSASSKEVKALLQNIVGGINGEIAKIKDLIALQDKKFAQSIKELQTDNAEKAHYLSRYIDDEIGKVKHSLSKAIDNIRNACAKIAEQLKKYIISFDEHKKSILSKMDTQEKALIRINSQMLRNIESASNSLQEQIREIKDSLEYYSVKYMQSLDGRIDQLSELVDGNLEILRNAIQDNREVFLGVINQMAEDIDGKNNNFVEDLEGILNEINTIKQNVADLSSDKDEKHQKMKTIVCNLEGLISSRMITEKSIRKAQLHNINNGIEKINIHMTQVEDKFTGYNQEIKQNIENINHECSRTKENFKEVKKEHKNIQKNITRVEAEHAYHAIVEKSIAKLESANIFEKLQQLQNAMESNKADKHSQDNIVELVDRKIQAIYEKLKKDNNEIWLECINLAGKDYMNIIHNSKLPEQLITSIDDSKKRINELENRSDQHNLKPLLKYQIAKKQTSSSPKKEEDVAMD